MWEPRRSAARHVSSAAPLTGLVLAVVAALLVTLAPARALADDPALEATTTAVTLDPASPVAGASAVARVTVTGNGSGATSTGTPTGTVQLSLGDQVWPVQLDAGTASLSIGPFPAGPSTLTATYGGDSTHAASTVSLSVTATPAPTTPPTTPPSTTVPTTTPPATKTPKTPKAPTRPTVRLVASADQVSVGDQVTLRWVTRGADKVKAAGAWKGRREAHGSLKVRLTTWGKNVFRLTATNAAGRDSARVMVMAARKAKTLGLVAPEGLLLVGTKVPVTGSGLAAGEHWTLRLGGKVVATGAATDKGTLAQTLTLATTTAEGVLPLTVTGSNPGRVGAATLSVIKPKQLDVSVESASVPPRGDQTVSLGGLLPGEPVTVTYHGTSIAQGVAAADGTFMLAFTVGGKKGEQSVTVTGGDPSRTGEATFTVVKDLGPTIG